MEETMTDRASVLILDEDRGQAHDVSNPPTPAELAKRLAQLGSRPNLTAVNGHQGAAPKVWAVDEMQQFYVAAQAAEWPDGADAVLAQLLERKDVAGLRFRGLSR